MRRTLLMAAAISLVAAVLVFATVSAATFRVYTAKLGSSHGTATLTIYTGGTGQVVVTAKALRPGSWYESIYRGTCSKLSTKVAAFSKVNVGSSGRLARTAALTKGQVALLEAHSAVIRLVSGSLAVCGSFTSYVAVLPTPTPTPTPPPTLGSTRNNPVPLGQSASVGDWTVAITAVHENATQEILAANMFNDPPAPSHQFFMIAVTAIYNGAGSDHLDPGYTFRAVGASNVGYTTFDDSCGVLPEPNIDLNDPQVFTGGTVQGWAACWSIQSADADSLEMYAHPFLADNDVWFALH